MGMPNASGGMAAVISEGCRVELPPANPPRSVMNPAAVRTKFCYEVSSPIDSPTIGVYPDVLK